MRGIIDKLNRQRTKKPLNIRLGIWGTTGSGKTTYLAMLYDCLQKDDEWIAELVQDDFLPIIRKNITRITEGGIFPDPTMTNVSGINVFSYAIRPRKKSAMRESRITLSFIDAPGEFYENLLETEVKVVEEKIDVRGEDENISETEVKVVEKKDEVGQAEEYKEYKDIVDYLINCHGMIVLLDPKRSLQKEKSYYDLLDDLFEQCKKRYLQQFPVETRLLPQYIAFCVSKIDSKVDGKKGEKEDLWEEATGKNPIELARKVMGDNLFDKLNNVCYFDLDPQGDPSKDPSRNRCNFYCVSSIGRHFDSETQSFVPIVEEHSEEDTPVGEDNEEYSEQDILVGEDHQKSSIDESSIEQDDDDWWGNKKNKKENILTPNHQRRAIKKEVNGKEVRIQPFCVKDPVFWLIRSIQENPPF